MGQNKNKRFLMWASGLIILIGLSGCNASSQTTVLPFTISAPSPATPQMTSTMTIISTRLFTQTPTPISMAPTSTSKSTSIPTWTAEAPSPTPGPTLAEADKEKLVVSLLRNNAGCELPCWWGFTPGVTTWEAARNFFLSYGENINSRFTRQNAYISGFVVDKYSFSIRVTLFVDQDLVRVINVESGTSPGIGKLTYGDPFFQKAMQSYTLSQIFSLLGKPEQVLILVDDYKDEYTFLPDYHILLFYPEKGVLAEYEGRSDTIGDKLRLCPAKTMISMWLWLPKESLTLEDVYSLSAGNRPEERKISLSYFRSWEEINEKSIDDFVSTFKNQNACFDTPAALWGRK